MGNIVSSEVMYEIIMFISMAGSLYIRRYYVDSSIFDSVYIVITISLKTQDYIALV